MAEGSGSTGKPKRVAIQNPQWRVQALSVPSPDSDLSLYVAFDNVRYLFGVGEGTQRTFVQRKIGLKGIEAVFVLGGDGEGRRVGGLGGVFMTAADAGIKHLDVCGPPSIMTQIASMRSFVMRDTLAITTHTTDPGATNQSSEPIYNSSALAVRTITLRPTPGAVEPVASSSSSPGRPFDWSEPAFRPRKLSSQQRRDWENTIINDMLRGPRSDAHATSFIASNPVPPSTTLSHSTTSTRSNPARPNTRAALPLVLPHVQESQLVYICEGPPVRGKFDVNRAKELGVPNGPLRGKLTAGNSIEFDVKIVAPDGSETIEKREVRPEQCLGGGEPGAVFILASVPDLTYLPSLLQSEAWAPYRIHPESTGPEKKVQLMVHRCSRAVFTDPSWQTWVQGFGPHTQHLIAQIDEFSNRATFNSACWNMLSMSLLDEQIFTIPHTLDSEFSTPSLPPNTAIMQPLHNTGMHPFAAPHVLEPRPSDIPFPTTKAGLEEAKAKLGETLTEYIASVTLAKEAVALELAQRMEVEASIGDDIVVTTLGTGSAIPSKYRNVSSTHLDIPGLGGVLFDAGEGTLGQLRRKFGQQALKKLYDDLKIIFISHMHADHHLGLAAVLEDRFRMGTTSELVLIAPSFIKLFLRESHAWQNVPGSNAAKVLFVDIARIKDGKPPPTWTTSSESETELIQTEVHRPWGSERLKNSSTADVLAKLYSLGLEVAAPEVKHRGKAYGAVLRHSSGWKVVYSGDTMPCNALVNAGMDATLLIHEATLEDDKPEMAQAKGHSTFGQAIDVGYRMNARHILLNHFSQRYPKLPRLQASSTPTTELAVTPVVSLSFDLMSIRVGDMWKMAHYKDAISLLFPAEEEADGEVSESGEPAAAAAPKNPSQPSGDPQSKNQQKKERQRAKQQQLKESKAAQVQSDGAIKRSAPTGGEPEREIKRPRAEGAQGEIRV